MSIKIIHKFEEHGDESAKRLLASDDAFHALHNVHKTIRDYLKYREGSKEEAENLLKTINQEIDESGLLDLYT